MLALKGTVLAVLKLKASFEKKAHLRWFNDPVLFIMAILVHRMCTKKKMSIFPVLKSQANVLVFFLLSAKKMIVLSLKIHLLLWRCGLEANHFRDKVLGYEFVRCFVKNRIIDTTLPLIKFWPVLSAQLYDQFNSFVFHGFWSWLQECIVLCRFCYVYKRYHEWELTKKLQCLWKKRIIIRNFS